MANSIITILVRLKSNLYDLTNWSLKNEISERCLVSNGVAEEDRFISVWQKPLNPPRGTLPFSEMQAFVGSLPPGESEG